MKKWKLQIEVSVADSWVADGFNLEERVEDIQEAFAAMLPYAYDNEVKTEIKFLKSPKKEDIEALQSGEAEIKD